MLLTLIKGLRIIEKDPKLVALKMLDVNNEELVNVQGTDWKAVNGIFLFISLIGVNGLYLVICNFLWRSIDSE